MRKILNICWKDLLVLFHDRAAWILMLAAPLVLTLALGLVSGAFSGGSSSGIQDIPVVIVNQDKGTLGNFMLEAFRSANMDILFNVTESKDVEEARTQVEDDKVAAAIIIPEGFSNAILPDATTGQTGAAVPIEIYVSPARPISSDVVRSVVSDIVSQMEVRMVSVQVAIQQLIASGRAVPGEVASLGGEISARLAAQEASSRLITVQLTADSRPEREEEPNVLAYLAPGMAVFFLMYTVAQGGRSILAERDEGTLSHMLISPTSRTAVLAGKVLSIFVAGSLQVGVLVLASSLLFGLRWGDPLGVVLVVLAVAAAATGWGILLASVARTPSQVSSLGTALMLLFGLLGGPFIPLSSLSNTMRLLSKITPLAWALDGFSALAAGGTLADVATPIVVLLLMLVLLFGLAVILSRRRWASAFMS